MAVVKTVPIKDFIADVPRVGPPPDGNTVTVWRFPEIVSVDAKKNTITTNIRVEVHNLNGAAMIINPHWLNYGVRLPGGLFGYIITDVVNTKTGKLRAAKPQVIDKGKNINRANETNVFTQALSEARGIYNKKMQLITPANHHVESTIKRYPPMLVSKADLGKNAQLDGRMLETDAVPVNFIDIPIYFQPKYNGIRAVIVDGRNDQTKTLSSDDVIIYGRSMKDVAGNDQIRAAIIPFILAGWRMYNRRIYFDGEIYTHGISLQEISGEARKEKDTGKLQFFLYDCFIPEQPELTYDDRRKMLDAIFTVISNPNTTGADVPTSSGIINQVPTTPIYNAEEAIALYKASLINGYEGGILRYGPRTYQYSYNGLHSKNILKMKPLLSSEFEMVGVDSAKKGKSKGNIIIICGVRDAANKIKKTFNVTFKDMTEDAQKELYKKMIAPSRVDHSKTTFDAEYRGKMITLDYYELSKDGVPLMAKAVAIRDYE